MKPLSQSLRLSASLLLTVFALSATSVVHAQSISCDFPNPDLNRAIVPPFGSPGDSVTLYPAANTNPHQPSTFTVGTTYDVVFAPSPKDKKRRETVTATDPNSLTVTLPEALREGPTMVWVWDAGTGEFHSVFGMKKAEVFTGLPAPARLPYETGVATYRWKKMKAAISTWHGAMVPDAGPTMYIPLDFTSVTYDANFMIGLEKRRYMFDAEEGQSYDVAFYSLDGTRLDPAAPCMDENSSPVTYGVPSTHRPIVYDNEGRVIADFSKNSDLVKISRNDSYFPHIDSDRAIPVNHNRVVLAITPARERKGKGAEEREVYKDAKPGKKSVKLRIVQDTYIGRVFESSDGVLVQRAFTDNYLDMQ